MQRALFVALSAGPPLAGGRIFDQVPEGAAFPYVTLGDEQLLDAGNSCDDGWEVFSDIHIWSRPRSGSKAEAKDLAAAVIQRTVNGPLVVAGFTVVSARLETQRSFRDPDGKTEHTVVTVRHILNPA